MSHSLFTLPENNLISSSDEETSAVKVALGQLDSLAVLEEWSNTRIHTDDVDPLHALTLLTSRTGDLLDNAIENSHSRFPRLLNQ